MNWVTWENVGVDRIGCAWLIRKYIDPKAKFVFITKGAAVPRDTEPFDIQVFAFPTTRAIALFIHSWRSTR